MTKKRSNQEEEERRQKTEKSTEEAPKQDQEMGEFEDMWEDEIESDGEVVVHENSDEEENDAVEDEEDEMDEDAKDTYLPGQEIGEDEVLVADLSVYEMLHSMNMEWPCLSFDFLRDGLGEDRKQFPKTLYAVAGSQADKPKDNKIYVMKMSQLCKTKQADDSDMSDDDELDEDPILEHKSIPHTGGVNRIRVMPHPTSHIVATWSDIGKVYINDATTLVSALDTPGASSTTSKPLYTVKGHREEGFALDWSKAWLGRLVSGDGNGEIYLTQADDASFTTESKPFLGHTSSIEDLQWSPAEKTVFASCSADKSIRIWDTRAKQHKPQLTVLDAHAEDVNVLTWNKVTDYLLASGSDDGSFSVWDLRTFVSAASNSSKPDAAATFKWHKQPITSIEWHPTEGSVLALSGSDDQVTLWDLSVERDPEEEKEVLGKTGTEALGVDVPPQLMFVHQGQKNVKEVHWHPQMPGVLATTAEDGFNVFQTINI